uniref:MARVEL domain-containing protein n=1 Tax=Skeletonema marinoi TaxID=267567 RepID=A0A6U3WM62_9STRA|mmetsp:Transcript_32975/g.56182  ORF Transcript_32975/g.56182 Transcript_32975/m.56182 type:complete len:183 (+) Transcript_32975:185-733(+)
MPNLANGFLCFGPATFVSVAFILSQFAQQGCSFVGLPSEGQDTNIFDKSTAAYAGIYCWQGVGGQKWLYAYAWEGLGYARQMALASTVMGAVVWCFFLFSSCMRYHPAIWFLLSLILLATTVTQALQFQMFSNDVCSDGGCTLGTSSRVGISACVFWFISAIMTCGIAKEAKDKQSSESEDN